MNIVQTAPLSSGTVRTKSKGVLLLSKKSGKYSSISMLLNKSKSSQNPAHLSRELQRLEPRIKLLENNACTLRSLVPFGLKELIDQTKNDLLSLQKIYISNENQSNEINDNISDENNAETNESKFDIDEELNEIKQRIFSRLDSSVESVLKMIKNKRDNFHKQEIENSKKIRSMNKNLIDFEEDYLDEIQQKIESTENLINEKHSRFRDRIKSIQKSAQELYDEYSISLNDDIQSNAQKLKSIEDDCKIHKGEITDIRAKIDEIKKSISNDIKEKMLPKVIKQNESVDNNNEKTLPSNSTPTSLKLLNQLGDLKQEADDLKIQFQNSIIELKNETDECENESQELTQKITSISSSMETIEANTNSVNKLIHEFQDKIDDLSSKIDQKEYKDSLISIIDTIKSTNEQIAKDIKAIKKKINLQDIPKMEEDANDNDT